MNTDQTDLLLWNSDKPDPKDAELVGHWDGGPGVTPEEADRAKPHLEEATREGRRFVIVPGLGPLPGFEPVKTRRWVFKEAAAVSPLRDEAVARRTDPGTSWEAARSITPEKLRESQEQVLRLLQRLGPMTDEEMCQWAASEQSPSGARSRRSELVSMGLVRDSGRKDTLRSGRRAIVWEAV